VEKIVEKIEELAVRSWSRSDLTSLAQLQFGGWFRPVEYVRLSSLTGKQLFSLERLTYGQARAEPSAEAETRSCAAPAKSEIYVSK